MQEWSLIHNQPMLKNIYKTPPIISYKRGKWLKDILVRAKLWRHISQRRNSEDTWGSQSSSVMIFSQQSLNCVKFRTKYASFPFESSRPPCLIFLGIWNTADFVSALEMSKISWWCYFFVISVDRLIIWKWNTTHVTRVYVFPEDNSVLQYYWTPFCVYYLYFFLQGLYVHFF